MTFSPSPLPPPQLLLSNSQDPSLPPNHLTIRRPPFTYLHLTLLSSSSSSLTTTTDTEIDILTFYRHLTSALQQFLGQTGLAIPIDFLKVQGADCWIRVPREDGWAVAEAVSGWTGSLGTGEVGWRVKGRGDWLGAVVAGTGKELFESSEEVVGKR